MFKAYKRESAIFHGDTLEELQNISASMIARLREEDGVVETLSEIEEVGEGIDSTFVQTVDYIIPIIKL